MARIEERVGSPRFRRAAKTAERRVSVARGRGMGMDGRFVILVTSRLDPLGAGARFLAGKEILEYLLAGDL